MKNGKTYVAVAVLLMMAFLGGSATAWISKIAETELPPGLNFGLGSLPLMSDAQTRSISAENPTGGKGMGGMAKPVPGMKGVHPDLARMGQGWKIQPFLYPRACETVTLMDVDGPGVIQHIWIVTGELLKHGRSCILRFYWDNETTPSIEVPVTDFFAVGHDIFAPVNSLPVMVNPSQAFSCFWPMPFRKHAKVTFSNDSKQDVGLLAYQINYAQTPVPKNAAYFHAQWRRANTSTQNPYVILDGVKGKGQYVGTFLAWSQLENDWFGEGEVKFYIDGDKEFPTICGTGTEDYFLSSYGFPHTFSAPFVGVPLKAGCPQDKPDGQVGTKWSLYRWHVMDPVHFQKDLRVTIHGLGWKGGRMVKRNNEDIASTAYWYQTEPHAPFPPLPSLAKRLAVYNKPGEPDKTGWIEGEDLKVIGDKVGSVEQQAAFEWSNRLQLLWRDVKPGSKLNLALPVGKAGRYKLALNLTRNDQYGIVQFYLDDEKIGEPVDLRANVAFGTEGITSDMGVHKLTAGEHKLTVEMIGPTDRADKVYHFGMDYLILKAE